MNLPRRVKAETLRVGNSITSEIGVFHVLSIENSVNTLFFKGRVGKSRILQEFSCEPEDRLFVLP